MVVQKMTQKIYPNRVYMTGQFSAVRRAPSTVSQIIPTQDHSSHEFLLLCSDGYVSPPTHEE